jgi:FkbM family methyltransferase
MAILARIAAALPSALKYRLRAARPVYRWLLRLGGAQRTVQLAPGTVRWQIDQLTSQAHLLGSYEPYMQEMFRRFIAPGGVVYDVGAHAGFHSLLAGVLVGPTGRVIAFEPDPENCRSLQKQLAANASLPVQALEIAVSDQSGTLLMRRIASSSERFVSAEGELVVHAARIDDLLASGTIPPPSLLKIDVEGHEAAVLRGAMATLAAHRPVVLCDYNDASTEQIVRDALAGLGYRVAPGPPVIATPVGSCR